MPLDATAIRLIQDTAVQAANQITEFGGVHFSPKEQMVVEKNFLPDPLKFRTLQALIRFYSQLEKPENHLFHIAGPKEVHLVGTLHPIFRVREHLATANGERQNPFQPNRFMDQESFLIWANSSFVKDQVLSGLLKMVGNLTDEDTTNLVDDGISQKVVLRSGVTRVSETQTQPLIDLRPFRTFPEITQPVQTFLLRIQKGPRIGLFEADGGEWELAAITQISQFLKGQLEGEFPDVMILG